MVQPRVTRWHFLQRHPVTGQGPSQCRGPRRYSGHDPGLSPGSVSNYLEESVSDSNRRGDKPEKAFAGASKKFSKDDDKAGAVADGAAQRAAAAKAGLEAAKRAEAAKEGIAAAKAAKAANERPKAAGLAVDGQWGPATTTALQTYLHVPADGELGPVTIKAFQAYLGAPSDGEIGPVTVGILQDTLGVTHDGDLGPATISALQQKLVDGTL
jgi:peptidoglycan hydrolase-like protein with peptidoglycan-binding domain